MQDEPSSVHIEEAALNAWPALQQILYDGWVLRFARGFTKRANSVNVISLSSIPIDIKVDGCEGFYAGKGLPPVFRLTTFNAPAGLDLLLERRGYNLADRTHVLSLDLTEWNTSPRRDVAVQEDELEAWLDIYTHLSDSPLERRRVHGEILAAIASRRFLLSVRVFGRAVACGLGVRQGEYIGLFDLVTAVEERGKGYGTALIGELLRLASAEGARYAYLQVVAGNAGARRLYDRLGFRESYQYWYRVG